MESSLWCFLAWCHQVDDTVTYCHSFSQFSVFTIKNFLYLLSCIIFCLCAVLSSGHPLGQFSAECPQFRSFHCPTKLQATKSARKHSITLACCMIYTFHTPPDHLWRYSTRFIFDFLGKQLHFICPFRPPIAIRACQRSRQIVNIASLPIYNLLLLTYKLK